MYLHMNLFIYLKLLLNYCLKTPSNYFWPALFTHGSALSDSKYGTTVNTYFILFAGDFHFKITLTAVLWI